MTVALSAIYFGSIFAGLAGILAHRKGVFAVSMALGCAAGIVMVQRAMEAESAAFETSVASINPRAVAVCYRATEKLEITFDDFNPRERAAQVPACYPETSWQTYVRPAPRPREIV